MITADDVLASLAACAGDPESVPPSPDLNATALSDLGYDSLALIALAVELEEQYGVRIPDEHLQGRLTMGKLVDLANASPRARDSVATTGS